MEIRIEDVEARTFLGFRALVPDPGPLFEESLPKLLSLLGTHGLAAAGSPLVVYYEVDDHGFDMAVGVPVGHVFPIDGEASFDTLPGGRAVVADYVGRYENLTEAWRLIGSFMRKNELTARRPSWEEYLEGPESGNPPDQWATRLVQPI